MENDVHSLVRAGESSLVEFKSQDFNNDSLAKEVVAFANTAGGTLLVGVEDSGDITGVEDSRMEERVVQICRNGVSPSLIPLIFKHKLNDSTILEVRIERGPHRPYKVKTSNKYYIRAGSVSIEPTNEELLRLFQAGGSYHFETGAIPNRDHTEIDSLRLRDYVEHYRNIELPEDAQERERFLRNLALLDAEGNLTNLGALFFARNLEHLLPQAGIQLFRFEGADKASSILDQRESYAPISEAIREAAHFIQQNSRVRAHFPEGALQRRDIAEFDPAIVRELIANAFCHRDWSITGQKIRLTLFVDRLELFSPGGLPNTMTLERALNGLSYYRNPTITQICRDYGFVEKSGRGLLRIMKRCREEGLPEPRFEIDKDYFNVILPIHQ